MLVLILMFFGCSDVQGAEHIEIMSDDWHGLEKRVLQLDCDGELSEDTSEPVSKEDRPALGSE